MSFSPFLLFLPFQIKYQIGKAFIFNKLKKIITGLLVRVRDMEGVIVKHPFSNFNKNYNLHSICIAYCFSSYNTEAQLSATCTK